MERSDPASLSYLYSSILNWLLARKATIDSSVKRTCKALLSPTSKTSPLWISAPARSGSLWPDRAMLPSPAIARTRPAEETGVV